MDLQDPTKKMSKSDESPQGSISVLDDPKAITKKIKSAVTDAGREVVASDDKPGVTNLLTILSVATGKAIPELEAAYAGKGYGDFKADVVVFDAKMVKAPATRTQPKQFPIGIDYVIVNGQVDSAGISPASSTPSARSSNAPSQTGWSPSSV